jgi:uncharacterized protein YecT (DUF1311 family)
MRVLCCFTAVVFSTAFVLAVWAADPSNAKSDDACNDPVMGTAGRSECYNKQYKSADAELNRVYGQVMSRLNSKSRQDALKTAQRAWISYRDKECEFDASRYEGGTEVNVVLPACLSGETSSRTDKLRDYLKMLSDR